MTAHPSRVPDRQFEPWQPSTAEPFDHRRLCHLLRRTSFGVSADRLRANKEKTVTEVIDSVLDCDMRSDPFEVAAEQLEGFVNFREVGSVASYWFYRMINSPQPIQERIALFCHEHWATGSAKVNDGRLMHQQIQTFRRLGLGNFRELAVAMGRDPAMLIWLDGQYNRKGKANENYGREVMELFTLGIGNYTEPDVKEMARAFTGWRVENQQAVFDARLFDDGVKHILGKTGNFDSESAVDVILSQPAASTHLAKNLLVEFVHPEPTDEQVKHYAQRLVDHDWVVKPVLREMLSSRMFFSDWAYRARIKSPAELAVGVALALGGKVSANFLRDSCVRLGQNLLNPPNVKGWPGGQSWINANTVLLRFKFVTDMATARLQNVFVESADYDGWISDHQLKTSDDLVDYLAGLLLDGEIPPDARKTLVDYMNKDTTAAKPLKLTQAVVNTKVRDVMYMMMTMPEYQLC